MDSWEWIEQDLMMNQEGSEYFDKLMDMAQKMNHEVKGIDDLLMFVEAAKNGELEPPRRVGEMQMPEPKPQPEGIPAMAGAPGVQTAGPNGLTLAELLKNVGPALKWLLGGSNKNPYGASNWGTAGEQFTRSIKRMED